MTLEKPWAEEFGRLLSALTEEWGGESVKPGKSAESEMFLYPEYRTEVDGLPLRVEIREFPGGPADFMEAGDNVEYLRVTVPLPTPFELSVSHEGLPEKISKLIGFNREFQTGAAEFDKRYWLKPGSDEGERLLREESFQKAVVELEPFVLLQLQTKFVLVSRVIKGEKQLEPGEVKGLVRTVAAIAAAVRSTD